MTEITADHSAGRGRNRTLALKVGERTRKRNAAEKAFPDDGPDRRCIGMLALVGSHGSILSNGLSSFSQTFIRARCLS
jgi:phosphate transport system permease protein